MSEQPLLLAARRHLSEAEAAYTDKGGLHHLEEGLALLEEVIADGAAQDQQIARNLAATYARKIYGHIRARLEVRDGLPEPLLEHFFKLILAFDHGCSELPSDARTIKIDIAGRLID